MARIRTIKPEFPHSESMGRVSRDARLLFIQLWTLADDSGRLRGNSRMLASLLFPYDDDAKDMIPGWMQELESVGCIDCYKVDGDSYVQIRNWLNHQKIDKPSKSKMPAFDESSRILANPRECSSEDQGRDQGVDQGVDLELSPPAEPTSKQRATRKAPADFAITDAMRQWAAAECPEVDLKFETARFIDHTFAASRSDWVATWRNWIRKASENRSSRNPASKHDLSSMNYKAGVSEDGRF